jgi:hypothetical protein
MWGKPINISTLSNQTPPHAIESLKLIASFTSLANYSTILAKGLNADFI